MDWPRTNVWTIIGAPQPFGKGARIAELGVLTEELQLAKSMGLFEFFEEAPAKQPREHAH